MLTPVPRPASQQGGKSSTPFSFWESICPHKFAQEYPSSSPAFVLCRLAIDGDANSLFYRCVMDQLTLGTAKMTFWGQEVPEETWCFPALYAAAASGLCLTSGHTEELFLFSCWQRGFACSRARLCPHACPWHGPAAGMGSRAPQTRDVLRSQAVFKVKG